MVANEEERMYFMQRDYTSNPNFDVTSPILNTQIKFSLTKEGRLCRIVWCYETSFDGGRENAWGHEKLEVWDLEKEGNKHDLMRAFKILALGNPKDFKSLYYVLKNHDEVVFPIVEETLKEVQETFNFN